MRAWLLIVLVLLGGLMAAGPCAGAEELTPIPAAEAERAVAEEVDYLVDVLWIGMDEYWHAGDLDSCLRLCREIVVFDPHFVDAYTGGAWLLWDQDRDAEAIALYEQGLAANPEDPDLYFDFGFYYRDRKQYEKAVAMFRQVVKHGGTRVQQHMLPNTLEEAGRKQEALAEWRQLLQRFPDDVVAKNKIARLEHEVKPPGEAH